MKQLLNSLDLRGMNFDTVTLPWPGGSWISVAVVALGVWLVIALLLFLPRPRRVARLKGLTWRRSDFCRGWLITGDTGSGKTTSGINQLAHQVFRNEPKWGGLCIDEKGVYWETLKAMAEHYGRSHDLIHLQIRPDNDFKWVPPHRFNLVGDRSIPFSTYAKFVVDTATSLGQGGDKGFFKSQAQTHIAHALELLFEMHQPVSLLGAYKLLSSQTDLATACEVLGQLLETPERTALVQHFDSRMTHQPPEQLGGVRETIGNFLQHFVTPDVAEIFCSERPSTFDFTQIDEGKIICVTMPQRFQTERRYVNTFLKLLFYNHALRRFDRQRNQREKNNLLILWADEAQRFMTASEDGTSDYNCVDVIREAGATIVAAAQSTTSFVPPLGNDKSKVLTLNLRNRLIFRAADEADAVQSADFLGKRTVVKRSWGYTGGKRTRNYNQVDEHKIKPHVLRNLRDHECILVHCERGHRRVNLPPLESDGSVARWFPTWRRLFG